MWLSHRAIGNWEPGTGSALGLLRIGGELTILYCGRGTFRLWPRGRVRVRVRQTHIVLVIVERIQVVEVELDRAMVAQALLPVLISLHLLVAHSQEWLCQGLFPQP